MQNMEDTKIVLITGANTGIGLETVKALLRSERRYHVLLCGRVLEKAKLAAEELFSNNETQSSVEAIQIDVEDDLSITKAYETLAERFPRIDCLVNNAGASFDAYIEQGNMTMRQAWNKSWDVNVTGAQIMTSTFLPLLLKSPDPRLLFVTSGLSSMQEASDPNNPGNRVPPPGLPKVQAFAGYRACKTGLNMMMVNWARLLKGDGVKVWSVAPGLLATSLGGNTEVLKKLGAKDPSFGGEVMRGVIEGKRDADVGKAVREYATPIQAW